MAVFVPNPERAAVEELIEDLAREIATRYRNAEDLLIREVAARAIREARLQAMLPEAPAGGGLTVAQAREQNRILAELAAERAASLRALQERAREVVNEIGSAELAQSVIALAAEEGSTAAAARLGFAGRQRVVVGTATQAVASLVLDLESRFEVLNARLTRYPQDAYQRIVSLYSPNTLLGVTTSRVQQAQAVQRFLAEGIPGFVDRSGRTWTIGAYAEMAGRTSVNRAFNDAGIWRMGQAGIHLATAVRGIDSCRKCAAWAGKILSTDGSMAGTVELPHATGNGTVAVEVAGTVQDARNAGWNHPNCRCRLVPYLPGLTVPQADTTYDEAAEKERAEQRQLEREIRAAKRREASAMNDTDRRRAAREVREAQADMREFIARTGRHRQSYREQLGFSGGTTAGGAPREGGGPRSPRSGVDIQIRRGTQLGDAVHSARSSIARVHTIPRSLPHLPVETANLRSGTNGVYRGAQSLLQMSGNGPTPRLTFAHEIGHYLDHRLLGTSTQNLESRMLTDPRTAAWLDVVRQTAAHDRLARLRAEMGIDPRVATHVDYLLTPVELWGRSYAQWIATRSGDEVMLRELDHYRSSGNVWTANRQWSTTDFEPVASAIDAIFDGKGLLK